MFLAVVTAAWAVATQASDTTARARLVAELVAVSDSLDDLRGAIARANRDLDRASDELVLARARDLRTRCAGADVAAARLDSLARRDAAALTRGPVMEEFRRELRHLRVELARCREEWRAGVHSDSLRAWGAHRLARLDAAARRYMTAALRLPDYPKSVGKDRVGMGPAVDSHFHNPVEIVRTGCPAQVYPPHPAHIEVS